MGIAASHSPAYIAGLQVVLVRTRQESGNRNNGLHWAACRAAESGLLDGDGVERLVEAALRSGLRGGEREARRTIDSALRGRVGPIGRFEREAAS
jgi:hypothetical protein